MPAVSRKSMLLSIRSEVFWTLINTSNQSSSNSNSRGTASCLWNSFPFVLPSKWIISTSLRIHLPGFNPVTPVSAIQGSSNPFPAIRQPFVLPFRRNTKWGLSVSERKRKLSEVPFSSINSISSPRKPTQKPPTNQAPISAIRFLSSLAVSFFHNLFRVWSMCLTTSTGIGQSGFTTSPTLLCRPVMNLEYQKLCVGTVEIHIRFRS
mmetsp:Transcript_18233/g.45141  ORF Transcript_18233/g.45141 Transcript_18233/m.45141 type:complete len:207 (+) Transcript_18233:1035-1655(+)